ncbi:Hypothetical predicted protein [Pelobates cultripes]|uniref:Uncharacterized protein n=1 Tax=Pelobates cultripes TaxID=61616 RepID=A0AAD1WJX8_PELCU|nr:Hypothetical predicted protein [Pelobates cultripes]
MGKRTQKPAPGTPTDSHEVGALLQRQAQHKMATQEEQEASADPLRQMQDNSDTQSILQGLEQTSPSCPDLSALATKKDIKNLSTDFQWKLAADIAVIQADMQVVTDRVHATEPGYHKCEARNV